jgi:hypothetical protein
MESGGEDLALALPATGEIVDDAMAFDCVDLATEECLHGF